MARDEIGERIYADFKKYDVGDILGIKGQEDESFQNTDR